MSASDTAAPVEGASSPPPDNPPGRGGLADLSEADRQRAAALRRMRLVATSLLVIAAIIFVATLHRDGWLGYVNATAEAAMVGAIADWFAVTALFRHPLGIPIPHTALVPRKKDVFAKSLEDFVVGHFLTGDAARERYLAVGASKRVGQWLSNPATSEKVVAEVARMGGRGLAAVRPQDVQEIVEGSLLPRLMSEPISPLAGQLLEQVARDRVHQRLVDILLAEAHLWLLDNPRTFMAIVAERAPTWAPSWVNNIVTDRVHTEALKWVRDVRENPDHRVRLAVDQLVADLGRDLQEDPATMAKAEAMKEVLLTHPQTGETVLALWEVLRSTLQRSLEDEDGQLRRRLVAESVHFGQRLIDDEELRTRVDERVADVIASVVATYGRELAPVISQVIARWDGKEAAQRIELHVGRDLQFIRINGTIVGGLAGFIIHALSQLAL
ncbi:uncharacterized membrane-anchored protein YjiN (DUF445 family) [Kineosphaera limosa]|uniref:DUF445 domain-containing protein n=1 Tax=Kineosphaera limosa NBRC 100340 TaxID=1184609 RepID=K6X6B8_9MICO|nr:DUF445 domain-containing protein [Kineosphaera limosa]NYE02898.1 uncharacterized membrane-anchored protein YjiN (DUF445 family) [Kineosphaera limosa]GAB94329.1 hypothetical protein KILIM_004_01210 [Kineosphaera limosa NBRC 100340]